MTHTIREKTFCGFDNHGHCGTVKAKTRRSAERLLREQITDGRHIRVAVSKHNCPECGEDTFGIGDNEPVTVGGWHGGVRYTWGRYAGVHLPRCTGKRCSACGHSEDIDPHFDKQ